MIVDRQALDALRRKGQTDPCRPGSRCKSAVIVAPALPQPPACLVEGQQGRDDQIRIDELGQRQGGWAPRSIRLQRLARRPGAEDHRGVAFKHHGQAQPPTGGGQGPGERLGIQLRSHRAIDGHKARSRQMGGMGGRALGGERLQGGQLAPNGAGLGAERCLVRARQTWVRAFLS